MRRVAMLPYLADGEHSVTLGSNANDRICFWVGVAPTPLPILYYKFPLLFSSTLWNLFHHPVMLQDLALIHQDLPDAPQP